jgi:hypothetical protein
MTIRHLKHEAGTAAELFIIQGLCLIVLLENVKDKVPAALEQRTAPRSS